MSWINRKEFPGQYADARVLGEAYAFNGPAGVHTSEGVKPPSGTDYLMFLRIPYVGPLQVAGKDHAGAAGRVWNGTSWVPESPMFGNRPVAYDIAGNLHVVRSANEPSGSIGIRYFNEQGPVYSKDTYADNLNSVYEYTDRGGVRIGQSGIGGAVAVIDGVRYLIEPGDTQMINVDRQGDHFAISMTKFDSGTVVIIQTTLEEILRQPIQFLDQPGPTPVPVPTPTPVPIMPEHKNEVLALAEANPFDKSSMESIFNFTRRVAWTLRGDGCGLLQKGPGGENEFMVNGVSYSISRVCYPDGHIFKILSDAGPGGQNGPQWADDGTVDPSRYRVAIAPDGSTPQPVPVPTPVPAPDVTKEEFEFLSEQVTRLQDGLSAVENDLIELRAKVSVLEAKPAPPLPKLVCKGKTESSWGHQHQVNLEVKVVE